MTGPHAPLVAAQAKMRRAGVVCDSMEFHLSPALVAALFGDDPPATFRGAPIRVVECEVACLVVPSTPGNVAAGFAGARIRLDIAGATP